MAFTDKGDTFDGTTRTITCAACGADSPYGTPLMDIVCGCGRVLSGCGRSKQPDLS